MTLKHQAVYWLFRDRDTSIPESNVKKKTNSEKDLSWSNVIAFRFPSFADLLFCQSCSQDWNFQDQDGMGTTMMTI